MDTAVRRATAVRDDHFGPVALEQIDGDLGWADKHGLVVVPRLMQNRSRLIVGTSGTGKTTDIEREAFRAARDGRKFFLIDGKGTDPGFVERAWPATSGATPTPVSPSGPSCPWTAGAATPPPSTTGSWPCSAGPSPTTKTSPPSCSASRSTPRGGRPRPQLGPTDGPDGPGAAGPAVRARPRPAAAKPSLVGRDQARAVKGAIGRFANFFAATAGGFDAGPAGWSFEDVDFAYLRAPYLAGRQDADAAMRLLLEDFAHYATLRKPRRGEDATLVFDEFSAIAGGREAAIQLVERVRDAGCALYLSAQSADGLGDEAQQRRLVGACSGGLLIRHARSRDPPAGRRGGQGGRADLAAGPGRANRQQLSPDRGAAPDRTRGGTAGPGGEAWYVARGRFEHLMVARTTISDGYRASARDGGPGPVLAAR